MKPEKIDELYFSDVAFVGEKDSFSYMHEKKCRHSGTKNLAPPPDYQMVCPLNICTVSRGWHRTFAFKIAFDNFS